MVLHTRMLDNTAQLQQEALGVLGVNLINSVLFHSGDPPSIIAQLLDDLTRDRIEVVRFIVPHSPVSCAAIRMWCPSMVLHVGGMTPQRGPAAGGARAV